MYVNYMRKESALTQDKTFLLQSEMWHNETPDKKIRQKGEWQWVTEVVACLEALIQN